MFNTQSAYSLVSRLALATPASLTDVAQTGFASLISNPFTQFAHSFGTLFGGHSDVFADAPADDPFGIPQYGYPLNDPAITVNPNTLTPQTCKTMNEEWANNSVTTDPTTGLDVHTSTDPCLLEAATVAAGGAYFNDSALTPDSASTDASSSTTPGAATVVSGDTSNMTCPVGNDAGVGDGYQNDKLIKIRLCDVQGAIVNAQIATNLNNMINAARPAGVDLTNGGGFRTFAQQQALRVEHGCPNPSTPSTSCSPDTAQPGYSNHQMGLAVDFRNCDTHATACYQWLKVNAAAYGLANYPPEPWHWSVGGK
jgi:hypothetical protein